MKSALAAFFSLVLGLLAGVSAALVVQVPGEVGDVPVSVLGSVAVMMLLAGLGYGHVGWRGWRAGVAGAAAFVAVAMVVVGYYAGSSAPGHLLRWLGLVLALAVLPWAMGVAAGARMRPPDPR